ncbi:hypothetical protein A9G17_00070 [Gilliamella sp. wkB7]|nr:hypothetical protein A9G17_00070 [Gilliamella apicola]
MIEDDYGEKQFSIKHHLNPSLIISFGILVNHDNNQNDDIFRKKYYYSFNNRLNLIIVFKFISMKFILNYKNNYGDTFIIFDLIHQDASVRKK